MSARRQKPIVVMAGGTGGHVFPALAVAEYLRAQGETIVWLGTRNGIEARLVPAADFAIEWLSVQGLRGKNFATLILAPFKLVWACAQAFSTLLRLRPKAVLGMGGFVAGPGGLMAWLLRIPLFIHEQNSVLGLTNRLLSRLAKHSYVAFPEVAQSLPRSTCIGNPVRADLCDLAEPKSRLAGREKQPVKLLVIGGSLGAAALNRCLPQALALIDRAERPQVKHQCGEKHLASCEQQYADAKVDAEVNVFIDDMRAAYAWADLVVCRAGALTVAELCAVGIASILIPFPYAVDNHQYHNALFLEQALAARIIIEDQLDAGKLASQLLYFQQNRNELVAMAVKARELAYPDAAERLAQGVLQGALK